MQSIYALSLSHLNEIGLGFSNRWKINLFDAFVENGVCAKVFVDVLT